MEFQILESYTAGEWFMLSFITKWGLIITLIGVVAVLLFYILFYSHVVNVADLQVCKGFWIGGKCIGGFK